MQRQTTSEPDSHDFARLRYFFWTYLDWHERLEALVSIGILHPTRKQPIPQTLERVALDTARSRRKLVELWDVVMRTVPAENREPNPFMERDAPWERCNVCGVTTNRWTQVDGNKLCGECAHVRDNLEWLESARCEHA